MSRHGIPGRAAGTQVVVGWDHPLLTYFVQVHQEGLDADENPVVWLGASYRELYDLDDLKRAIRPYADLPADLAVTLYADRDEGR